MTPAARNWLRALVALLASLLLSTAVGVGAWAADARGELSYERDVASVCAVQQDAGSRHMDCTSLNAVVASPFALVAGVAALVLAWRPEIRAASWTAIGMALAGVVAVVVADIGTPRRDWAFAAIAIGLAISCWALARSRVSAAPEAAA